MAAAIPISTGAGTNTGCPPTVANPAVAGTPAAEGCMPCGSESAAPGPSWSSFLEALGIAGNIVVGRPASISPQPLAVSSNPCAVGSKDQPSSLTDDNSL